MQLHMLGDGTVRGATLETCLAKVLYCSSELQRERGVLNITCLTGMSMVLSCSFNLNFWLHSVSRKSSNLRPF